MAKKPNPLFLPGSDADYALHPVAEAMKRRGLARRQALPSLTTAATRMLTLAVSDSVPAKSINAEARRIASKLLAA